MFLGKAMTDIAGIIQSPLFAKQKEKLHKQQIQELDKAIKAILKEPSKGKQKKGDLKGVQVYKFKLNSQLVLIAYGVIGTILYLYTFGSHENFYRGLKKYLND